VGPRRGLESRPVSFPTTSVSQSRNLVGGLPAVAIDKNTGTAVEAGNFKGGAAMLSYARDNFGNWDSPPPDDEEK